MTSDRDPKKPAPAGDKLRCAHCGREIRSEKGWYQSSAGALCLECHDETVGGRAR